MELAPGGPEAIISGQGGLDGSLGGMKTRAPYKEPIKLFSKNEPDSFLT